MPTIKVSAVKGNIAVGAFELPLDAIQALDTIDVTGKAIRLHDGRVSFTATPKGSKTPVTFTAALTITRDPLDDDESKRVAVKAEEQKARKAAKASEELALRDREFKRGSELTQNAIMGTLANVNTIMGAAKALNIGGK